MPRPIEESTSLSVDPSAYFEAPTGLEVLQRFGLFLDVDIDRHNPIHQRVIQALLTKIRSVTRNLDQQLDSNEGDSMSRRKILIHDIRGFLTVITNNLELLLDDEVEVTTRAVVADVLSAVTKLTARTIIIAETWEDTRTALTHTCPIMTHFSGYELLSQTRLSPEDLSTIIMNATINAKKEGASQSWVQINEANGYIIMTITDDGPGFSHEEGILNLLSRGGFAFGRTGNGLTYIQHLVKNAGGTISFSNHPDQDSYGAVLTIELPKL